MADALINPTVEHFSPGVIIYTWASLDSDDSGTPIQLPSIYLDGVVQITGTFGVGGTVVVEGTNSSATSPTYATLSDGNNNSLSFTAAGIKNIGEPVYKIRPRVTAGDGTTALTIKLSIRIR